MAVEPTANESETDARKRPRRRRGRGGRKPAAVKVNEAATRADPAASSERVSDGIAHAYSPDAVEPPDDAGPVIAEPPPAAVPLLTVPAVARLKGEVATGPEKKRGRRGGRRRRGKGKSEPIETAAPTLDQAYAEEPTESLFERDDELLVSRGEEGVGLEVHEAEEEVAEEGGPAPRQAREMIINTSDGDECRIAILQDGRLEELFIERQSTESYVGNIYSGRITNVEPSIQAAFIDFGQAKNGFLHISDVQPQYFPDHRGEAEEVGRKVPRRDRPPIQKCFRRGDAVIVQVTKEGIGTKGPTLSTYLSIPGRYLVMMPGMSHHGVSRKIEDEVLRRKMREALMQLELPKGMGFILRTAGVDQPKRELQRDLHYLQRLWKTVAERIRTLNPPAELYRESDLLVRTIRDVYTNEFKRIVVDDEPTGQKVREFLRIVMPRTPDVVEVYRGREPLFHKFRIDAEIDRINSRRVPLPSGGSIVIDPTEALVAIDVNSGKFRELSDAEETAYKTNLEAAEEIARQLRLRDLGGVIVCDFIDMRYDRHKRNVEKALRDALKKHKERARILRTSSFGLIEMTRQRQRRSIRRALYADCPQCHGSGLIKTPETMSLDVMRVVHLAIDRAEVTKVTVVVSPAVASLVQNRRRAALNRLESETNKTIEIRGEPTFTPDQLHCMCEDAVGRTLPPIT
ncbi:MAG TPA: Rne/Rng family ribonuclease [Phycisphaerae bacterium]|jgi:ribonuclease E